MALLTTSDLAERWGLSGSDEVIATVKREGVPFVPLRRPDMRLDWKRIRFRLADVEAWEADRTRTFRTEPERTTVAIPRPAVRRLGAWQ